MHSITYYYLRFIEEVTRFLANKTSLLVFDKLFCKAKYRRILKKKLNLKNPQGFNEKMQWLKLYDRNPLYTQLADKYAVREFVQERVGSQYLNELLGVYTSVDEINFDNLPNQFALKANHGCGWNIICNNKKQLDIELSKAKLSLWLKSSFYHRKGEWQYKNIPPRIICEKYLGDLNKEVAIDYKFYCFNGKPKFINVVLGRFINHTEAYYDEKWTLQSFHDDYPFIEKDVPKPDQWELMVELAKKLSAGIKFCRVDLYFYKENVYFGEITFYPYSGFQIFVPPETDYLFGELIDIDNIKR